MNHFLRFAFFLCFVRPIVLIAIGLNVRHREPLPSKGPVLVIANHNSHLDTLVLMSLFPLRLLPKIRPVGAADYFFRGGWSSWFSSNIIGIIPIERGRTDRTVDPLAGIHHAIEEGDIVIFFPEGSRGNPEKLAPFKGGIAHLPRQHPNVPIVPIFLHGLGKALPKGEGIFVPFFCDVFVGESVRWTGDKEGLIDLLSTRMDALANEGELPVWE